MITANEQDKVPKGTARSTQWPAVRRAYLKTHGRCAVCDGTKKLDVHHIAPFHIYPELELEAANFITLCENNKDGVNCHLFVGHLGNFKSYNSDARADAAIWNKKIRDRPKG